MRKRILVVEDDDALRGLYRTTLSLAGYSVDEADDGLVALNVIDNNPPDLIILDLMLPTVDGFVVQQDISARTRTRTIPVIIVTGTNDELPENLGVASVLRKPVDPDEVLAVVRRCLRPSEEPAAGV